MAVMVMIRHPRNGSDRISSGMGNDTINLSENHAAQDTLHYSIDDGSANVDTVTGFDVRVVNDIISIDVSELSTPITVGDGSTAKNTNAGNISIIENALDANISHASNTTESIIKLMQTDKTTFADALGTGEIAVADGACINFLWYNTRDSQAVYGM